MRALFVLACFISAAAHAAPAMQPGMWEITVSAEMSNVPMKMPAQTFRRCITEADVADSKKTIPADKSCKLEDVKTSGDTTRWKASCKTEMGDMKGSGQMSVKPDSYQGAMNMAANLEGERFEMKSTFSGKRVGDCK